MFSRYQWDNTKLYSFVTWLVKVKCTLVQALRLCTGRTARRESRGIALLFHDHGNRRGWGVSVTPRPLFTPRERPGTHCTGGQMGPRAGLDRCGKSRLPSGFDPRIVQPVAIRYTDYATRPTSRIVVVHYFWGQRLDGRTHLLSFSNTK